MSDGFVLKCRCGCRTNTKVRGFRELHKFNEHHVKEHIQESDAKVLVSKAIPNPSWRHCRLCTRNGKMKGFHTHNNMLAHYITEHFDHETQVNIYHAINEEFPWNGGEDLDDDCDFASVSSRSSIGSRYSTASERSIGNNSTASLERSFGSWGANAKPQADQPPALHASVPAPAPPVEVLKNAPGMLTQDEFLIAFPGAARLDYWQYKSDFNIQHRATLSEL